MPTDCETYESAVDEYMWPLSGDSSAFNWTVLAEELEIRARLGEILTHVRDTHIAPRLRRLGVRPSLEMVRAVEGSVIAGPTDGPLWSQTLQEPIPRALRYEWDELTRRLRAIKGRAARPDAGDR